MALPDGFGRLLTEAVDFRCICPTGSYE
eukprot:COSAG06_NODE_19213_length_848_cov_33.885180_1_plen_27_part_10